MQAASEKLRGINSGKVIPQAMRTFAVFVNEDWSPVVLPTLKYATQKHYQYMLNAHLIPAFGNRQLRDINREELQGFLSRKLAEGLSWETVHHFKCGLSKILGSAEEWGYICDNPAVKTKLPRRQYGAQRIVLTPEQVRGLVVQLDEPARSVTLLLVLTGLRFVGGTSIQKPRRSGSAKRCTRDISTGQRQSAASGRFPSVRKRRRFSRRSCPRK
jgi:hypothetical protein